MSTSREDVAELDVAETVTDEQLIRSCLQGDHAAWCALIDRYRNLIFSIPVKQGFLREDAAEVFQEVCLKLLAHLPRLRTPRTLAAWLITVTSHECSRLRRQSARYRELKVECRASSVGTEFETTVAWLDELHREQALREAVSELGGRCRELVRCLFFTTPPVPYQQLAQRLGVATSSIGFIRMRCLKRLRRLLEDKGFS